MRALQGFEQDSIREMRLGFGLMRFEVRELSHTSKRKNLNEKTLCGTLEEPWPCTSSVADKRPSPLVLSILNNSCRRALLRVLQGFLERLSKVSLEL